MKPKYSMSKAIAEANKRVFISYGFSFKIMRREEGLNTSTVLESFYYANAAKEFAKAVRISEALRIYMNENEPMYFHQTIPASFIKHLITTSKLDGITSKSTPLAIAKVILNQNFHQIPNFSH